MKKQGSSAKSKEQQCQKASKRRVFSEVAIQQGAAATASVLGTCTDTESCLGSLTGHLSPQLNIVINSNSHLV